MELDKELIINTIMNNSQDTIYIKDKNCDIILSSKAHSLLWGVKDPSQVVGRNVFDYFPEPFAQETYQDEQEIMATGIPMIGKIEKLIKPDGEVIWFSSSKYPFHNSKGKIIGTWGTSKDITSLKKVEEELLRVNKKLEKANKQLLTLSAKDDLSGLYNYRYFYEELEKTFDLYKRQKQKDKSKDFSLILVDIDDFKLINDSCGHLMGDYAITYLAETMVENVRSSDSCFRYGGDEFAILLIDADKDKALEVAGKMRKAIGETPITCKYGTLTMTISMGVASFSESNNMEDLIYKADQKLYQSKKSGKNKVR